MTPTFITTGIYETVYKTTLGTADPIIDHYKVGRKGMDTIRLTNFVNEYGVAGNQIHIDEYGFPWVKCT
jgi:hypothetical protein